MVYHRCIYEFKRWRFVSRPYNIAGRRPYRPVARRCRKRWLRWVQGPHANAGRLEILAGRRTGCKVSKGRHQDHVFPRQMDDACISAGKHDADLVASSLGGSGLAPIGIATAGRGAPAYLNGYERLRCLTTRRWADGARYGTRRRYCLPCRRWCKLIACHDCCLGIGQKASILSISRTCINRLFHCWPPFPIMD